MISQEFQREDCVLAWKGQGKGELPANRVTYFSLLACLVFSVCLLPSVCVSEHLEEHGGPQLLRFLVLRSRQTWDLIVPFHIACLDQVCVPDPPSYHRGPELCRTNGPRDHLQGTGQVLRRWWGADTWKRQLL